MAMHSKPKLINHDNYTVHILPALEDNFMYIINQHDSKDAIVIDPVDADLVYETVKDRNLNLLSILTTHHHWDHAGGNEKMLKFLPTLNVYGGDDRVNCLTKKLTDGDKVSLNNLEIKCLFTPCHTSGHLCYFLQSSRHSSVFTGDTLFIGGCGRFFEGTADQMYKALVNVLGHLPDNTEVYCGHEYSVSNLKYGQFVEPDNEDIQKHLKIYQTNRKDGEATVPSTIGLEKLMNPFMRVDLSSVQKHCKTDDHIQAMDYLRNEKNNFKG
ncbi:unnamed protein product [Gordionus sp. m RMFG-2023]